MRYRLLLFFFATLISYYAYAQEETEQTSVMTFSFLGGASLPQGDFGSTNGQKAGYSKIGFVAMLEGSKLSNPSTFWTSSVSLSVNGLDDAEMQNQAGGISVDGGSYVTTWVLTGLKFGASTSEKVRLYGVGQIGILFSSFPDITLSYMGQSITQTTKIATAFAYGFGAGVQLNKMNIGLRYYFGEPEYEQSASSGGYSATAKVKLPTTVLMLLLGVEL